MKAAEMTLDERVRELFDSRNSSIMVVGDSCTLKGKDDVLTKEHYQNESVLESCAQKSGVNLDFFCLTHEDVMKEDEIFLRIKKPELILIKAHSENFATLGAELARSAANYEKLKEIHPNAEIHYIINDSSKLINDCVDQLLPIFAPNITPLRLPFNKFPTIMHFLNYSITGRMEGKLGARSLSEQQHEYKNAMWGNYLPFIDSSLRAGNSQSKINYRFLILSDREMALIGNNCINETEKVTVHGLDYKLKSEDMEDCAAMFIDNAWDSRCEGAVGKGIETLKRVKRQMEVKGIHIPIIYQSGHQSSAFSKKEQEHIASFGAVLATKDIFPKVCKNDTTYQKELEVGRLVQMNASLAKYTAQVFDANLVGDKFKVVCTKIVTNTGDDLEKKACFAELGVENNETTHKMYVLAMFHSTLKDQLNNKKLRSTSKDYFTFNEIQDSANQDISFVKNLYTAIVEKHRKLKPTIITHNDAKWDNWFNGTVLGDFGSVQPGTEHKDLAKALLNNEGYVNRYSLAQGISAYISFRSAFDSEFRPSNDFARTVEEALLTESMRTLYYKADQKIAEQLVETIRNVANTLNTPR